MNSDLYTSIAAVGGFGLLYGLAARRSITGNLSMHCPYGWRGFQLALLCAALLLVAVLWEVWA